jgi:Ca2+-binding EF-hand superfamily protein
MCDPYQKSLSFPGRSTFLQSFGIFLAVLWSNSIIMPRATPQESENQRIEEVESQLKKKLEVSTGFADPEVRARKLAKEFAYFDTDGSGEITYDEFLAAMIKMNFVGVNHILEALFNRYDEDASGSISYSEFAFYLFDLGEGAKLDPHSKNIVERVKARIIEAGGAGGIWGCKRILSKMDSDGSKNLDKEELKLGMAQYGVKLDDGIELDTLFKYFDRDGNGRINVDELMIGLRTGMSFSRKQIVRRAFNLLDADKSGFITVSDILQFYDTTSHPGVLSGKMTPEEAAGEMLSTFEKGGEVDGIVTWKEFLDYYRGMSVAIEDDKYFELMMRNAWHLSGGDGEAANTTCRRLLVKHTDGSEEVVELRDDLGMKLDRETVIAKLKRDGITDIADVKL